MLRPFVPRHCPNLAQDVLPISYSHDTHFSWKMRRRTHLHLFVPFSSSPPPLPPACADCADTVGATETTARECRGAGGATDGYETVRHGRGRLCISIGRVAGLDGRGGCIRASVGSRRSRIARNSCSEGTAIGVVYLFVVVRVVKTPRGSWSPWLYDRERGKVFSVFWMQQSSCIFYGLDKERGDDAGDVTFPGRTTPNV